MVDGHEAEFVIEQYYSLLELLDQLGKEGVAELVAKGKPNRVTRGDMIYFLKQDVNRILGRNLEPEDSSTTPEETQAAQDIQDGEDTRDTRDSAEVEQIVDDTVADNASNVRLQVMFKQSLIKRGDVGKEEAIYRDKNLDLAKEVVIYGRSHGDAQDRNAFKGSAVISAMHGKLYLDDENNLLYENLGSNKSKIRGSKEQAYTILNKDETGVLMTAQALQEVVRTGQPMVASIKLGFQLKPHFIVRIVACSKDHQDNASQITMPEGD